MNMVILLMNRARADLLGTAQNRVGTTPWANRGWNYWWYRQCPMVKSWYSSDCGRRVGAIENPWVPFDRARRDLFGTPWNRVGTIPWANRDWNYSNLVLFSPTFLCPNYLLREKRQTKSFMPVIKKKNVVASFGQFKNDTAVSKQVTEHYWFAPFTLQQTSTHWVFTDYFKFQLLFETFRLDNYYNQKFE